MGMTIRDDTNSPRQPAGAVKDSAVMEAKPAVGWREA